MTRRRRLMLTLPAALATLLTAPASAEEAAWQALRGGGIILFRHAIAPGGGDPPEIRLGDCATQRNLDAAGRQQARRIGEAIHAAGVAVAGVIASEWCRTMETSGFTFAGFAANSFAFQAILRRPQNRAARNAASRDGRLTRGPETAAVLACG
jgi:hypothetical protein